MLGSGAIRGSLPTDGVPLVWVSQYTPKFEETRKTNEGVLASTKGE